LLAEARDVTVSVMSTLFSRSVTVERLRCQGGFYLQSRVLSRARRWSASTVSVPRPSPQCPPEALPYPILSPMSSTCGREQQNAEEIAHPKIECNAAIQREEA